ncbi:MAG: 2,3-diphosphoglycerate-dependent phosphoglycerate mutase [Bacilli bacterium]|nr:2,3-diphosphoglycerate-dependent phosphoglycerate mutase [Bacilli bacterium]
MKLVIIRHGESEWNKLNLFTGWTDVDLSEKGKEEAKQAGLILKEKGYDFDLCYTSVLKRAINTLNYTLEGLDREWLPVIKSWKLNERHYGALQGLNKAETAAKYGEEQVKIWRRSFGVQPPLLDVNDPRCPSLQIPYRDVVDKSVLPRAESLKDTIARAVPYFESEILPQMKQGKRVLIVAHGNSIRALVKYFEKLDEKAIIDVNIPTGIPLVYEFDDKFHFTKKYYLLDEADLQAKMASVANQGKVKK